MEENRNDHQNREKIGRWLAREVSGSPVALAAAAATAALAAAAAASEPAVRSDSPGGACFTAFLFVY